MIQADRITETTCPFCGVGCQMDLHIKDEQIFRVSGRFDNEVNFGNLCVKGRFGYDFVHAPDRLTEPMIRESRKEAFKLAGWDEALATVAARLQEIRDHDGADSVAILTSAKCTNEENYLLQKFARAVIGTNNVDHCARL